MKPTHVLAGAFLLAVAVSLSPAASAGQDEPRKTEVKHVVSGLDDFDFLVGDWHVHSRRLKERLAGSDEWVEFDGTIRSRKLLDGWSNVDETVFNLPEGVYPGIAPRAYDPTTGLWAIWWIDGRNPHGAIDPPVKGRFVDGVGTFYADTTLNETPIKVRFIWSHITQDSARWEQAFSADGGTTWETNWVQKLTRTR